MGLVLVSSPRFFDHTPPPGHPERPERAHVFDVVADEWRARGGRVVEPRPATLDEIARVHARSYIEQIEGTRGRAVMLDEDTYTSPETADLALLAAGGTITATEHVLENEGDRALALVRPPGHHAEAGMAMGFCYYNNVAVAAAAALASGIQRIAIVDFDVHHGNATQHMFEDDDRVLFVSMHQYPFYPGTGAADEAGRGRGRGFTVNLAMEAGSTDGDYLVAFERIVAPIVDRFAPRLVLVSAGFDAHEHDPLAHMRMTSAGYGRLTAAIADLADRHARGGLVLATEGGYELTALGESLHAVVRVLSGDTAWLDARSLAPSTGRGERAADAARAVQAPYWPGI
ncbi:MAG TPA: histone deacetylase [Vicinamibacterales bacterium]|nr:histone deacetylase [Vicinamibacterales bacterium]